MARLYLAHGGRGGVNISIHWVAYHLPALVMFASFTNQTYQLLITFHMHAPCMILKVIASQGYRTSSCAQHVIFHQSWTMELGNRASYSEIEPRSILKWKSTWINAVLMGSIDHLAVMGYSDLVLYTPMGSHCLKWLHYNWICTTPSWTNGHDGSRTMPAWVPPTRVVYWLSLQSRQVE